MAPIVDRAWLTQRSTRGRRPDLPASIRLWPDRSSLRLAVLRLRAVRGELLQQRESFPLDLDHPPRFRQVGLQPRILVVQLRHLMLKRISRWSTTHRAQP